MYVRKELFDLQDCTEVKHKSTSVQVYKCTKVWLSTSVQVEASVISGAAGRSKPICTKSSFPAIYIVYLCKCEISCLCICKY